MSALLLVRSFEGHEVRVAGTHERPMFVAGDLCGVLGIKNAADTLNKRIPEDEKGVETIYTPGGEQKLAVVTEAGLYRLVFRSNKPEAERFQRWVFHEVLPQIRETGSYIAPGAPPPQLPEHNPAAEAQAFLRGELELELLRLDVVTAGERALAACDAGPADLERLRRCVHAITERAAGSGRGLEIPTTGISRPPAGWLTVENMVRWLGKSDPEDRVLVQIGKVAASLFRERHKRAPQRQSRIIRGVDRAVAVYGASDHDLLEQACREVLEAEGLPPRLPSQRDPNEDAGGEVIG